MVKKSTSETAAQEDIARLYHRAANELPPAHLDAAILQAARSAVTSRPVARSPFSSVWTVPTSLAAVLVLSVTLVVFMSHERTVPVAEPLPASTETVAPEMPARDEVQARAANAPEIAPPPTASPDAAPTNRPIKRAVTDNLHKERSPQPAAPARTGENVFETLKPFSKTMPAQSAPASAAALLGSHADVTAVQTKGDTGAYTFVVKIEGIGVDRGQDVDRWEVLSEDGRLLYRSVLSPDDIKERAFTSAGGPIPIGANTNVWILVHTSSAGYRPVGFKGSPRMGFRKTEMPTAFAAEIAQRHGGQAERGLSATPAR